MSSDVATPLLVQSCWQFLLPAGDGLSAGRCSNAIRSCAPRVRETSPGGFIRESERKKNAEADWKDPLSIINTPYYWSVKFRSKAVHEVGVV